MLSYLKQLICTIFEQKYTTHQVGLVSHYYFNVCGHTTNKDGFCLCCKSLKVRMEGHSIRQDKTKEDKTSQDKTGQDRKGQDRILLFLMFFLKCLMNTILQSLGICLTYAYVCLITRLS